MAELTPMERRVLDLVTRGKCNKRIAYELGYSISTVKRYVSNILEKLGVQSRVEAAVAYKMDSGK